MKNDTSASGLNVPCGSYNAIDGGHWRSIKVAISTPDVKAHSIAVRADLDTGISFRQVVFDSADWRGEREKGQSVEESK